MFFPIQKILEKRIRQYRFWPEISAFKVCQLWQEEIEKFFGKKFLNQIQPLSFKRGVLFVQVKNPALAQELQFRGEEVKRRINKRLKENILKKIVYRIT